MKEEVGGEEVTDEYTKNLGSIIYSSGAGVDGRRKEGRKEAAMFPSRHHQVSQIACLGFFVFLTLIILSKAIFYARQQRSSSSSSSSEFPRHPLLLLPWTEIDTAMTDGQIYASEKAFEHRAQILEQTCRSYSGTGEVLFPPNQGGRALEPRRMFLLNHGLTVCIPDIQHSDLLTILFQQMFEDKSESDLSLMDPCREREMRERADRLVSSSREPGRIVVTGSRRGESHSIQESPLRRRGLGEKNN